MRVVAAPVRLTFSVALVMLAAACSRDAATVAAAAVAAESAPSASASDAAPSASAATLALEAPTAIEAVAIATAAFAERLRGEFPASGPSNLTIDYLRDIGNYDVVVSEHGGDVRVQFVPRDINVEGGGGEYRVDGRTGAISGFQGYE